MRRRRRHIAATSVMSDVLALYTAAAEAGLPPPTRDRMEGLVQRSRCTIIDATRLLEEAGVIKVEHYRTSYRVQIVATGKWTANNHGGGNTGRTAPRSTLAKRACCKCRKPFRPAHRGNFICGKCTIGNREDRLNDQWTYCA